MRKNLKVGLALVAVAIVAGVAWYASRPSEPMYQGRPLSEWLQRTSGDYHHSENHADADAAVRAIGTNAIPTLLGLIQERDSLLEIRLLYIGHKLHLTPEYHESASVQNFIGWNAFRVLGESASNAVPELIKIYGQDKTDSTRNAIIATFGGIGPAASAAIPLLITNAASTNFLISWNCLSALGEIHSEPQRVVPVLRSYLRAPQALTRRNAAAALARYGTNAQSAIPVLLDLMNDPDAKVRATAIDTLKVVDPEVKPKNPSHK